MLFATFMSDQVDYITYERLKKLLLAANLPISIPPKLSASQLQQAMSIDKKIINNQLKWILLKKLGGAYISDSISSQLIDTKILEFMSI